MFYILCLHGIINSFYSHSQCRMCLLYIHGFGRALAPSQPRWLLHLLQFQMETMYFCLHRSLWECNPNRWKRMMFATRLSHNNIKMPDWSAVKWNIMQIEMQRTFTRTHTQTNITLSQLLVWESSRICYTKNSAFYWKISLPTFSLNFLIAANFLHSLRLSILQLLAADTLLHTWSKENAIRCAVW